VPTQEQLFQRLLRKTKVNPHNVCHLSPIPCSVRH
jgi:hypothetical protein